MNSSTQKEGLLTCTEVCECYWVIVLHRTPIFDWCVLGKGQRTNITKAYVEKILDYVFQKI